MSQNFSSLTFIILFIFSTNQGLCATIGSFDKSFSQDGNSDGWDFINQPNQNYFGLDTLIDSQKRIVVAGTYTYGASAQTGILIARYLTSGILDTSFASNGILKYPFPPSDPFIIKIRHNPFDDSIFVGYTALNNSTGNSDVSLLYIDETGLILDIFTIAFDLGSGNDRKDDFFADMKLHHNNISGSGFLIIAAEVERSSATDTDFGIAKVNFDSSGNFSFETQFSSDGMSNCFHDHNVNGLNQDIATSISITEEMNYLVGGSAFEGNGDDANGWNLAFCEFNNAGAIIGKWSTKISATQGDSREELVDTVIGRSSQDGQYLLTLSKEPEIDFSVKNDFVVRKYIRNLLNQGVWDEDINFASSGISRIGFNDPFIFPETTDDQPAQIFIKSLDQSIIIVGNSNWQDNGNDKSYISLSKLRSNGLLNTSWGSNSTGKEHISLDTNTFSDICAGFAQGVGSEEFYVTGTNFDFTNNTIKLFIANIAHEFIFSNSFE